LNGLSDRGIDRGQFKFPYCPDVNDLACCVEQHLPDPKGAREDRVGWQLGVLWPNVAHFLRPKEVARKAEWLNPSD
jgi:hypothetical protein